MAQIRNGYQNATELPVDPSDNLFRFLEAEVRETFNPNATPEEQQIRAAQALDRVIALVAAARRAVTTPAPAGWELWNIIVGSNSVVSEKTHVRAAHLTGKLDADGDREIDRLADGNLSRDQLLVALLPMLTVYRA